MVAEYQRRRDYAVRAINQIQGLSCNNPAGAFYIFVNIKKLNKTSAEVSDFFLNDAGLTIVPGTVFGERGEGYLRLSYANSYDRIVEACERLKNSVKKLY
jgi:aminotransferase